MVDTGSVLGSAGGSIVALAELSCASTTGEGLAGATSGSTNGGGGGGGG
jgi:hypothetical protein